MLLTLAMNQEDKNLEQALLRKINQHQARLVDRQAEKVEQLHETVERQSKKVMQQKQDYFENQPCSES